MIRIVTLAALVVTLLGGCEFRKATDGVQRATRVVQALERYREDRGAYPDSLATLTPDFLPVSAVRPPEGIRDRYPLSYRRTGDSYELRFRYGTLHASGCIYQPAIKQWDCE